MENRTAALRNGDTAVLKKIEEAGLESNARFNDWECSKQLMSMTRDGKALYMHCLPADISGVSCEAGEVAADVFERYRLTTYREASHKPFVIAAIMMLTRFEKPAELLRTLLARGESRRLM